MNRLSTGAVLLMVGLALWLVDFWFWAAAEVDVPVAQIGGVALILIGSIFIGSTRHLNAGGLVIGSLLWLVGVVLHITGKAGMEAIATAGEAIFFFGLCAVGMIVSGGNARWKKAWTRMLVMTSVGIGLTLLSIIFNYDIGTEMPIVLVSVMTLYAAALSYLLITKFIPRIRMLA